MTPTNYEQHNVLYESELSHLLYMFDINDKWYDIGLSLWVRRNVLNDLKSSQKNDVEKLSAVIENFLTTQPSPVSWKIVITATESHCGNNKALTDRIRQYLNTGKKSIKVLLLSNEVINNGVQTIPVCGFNYFWIKIVLIQNM